MITGFYHVAGRYRQIAFCERATISFHSARRDPDSWASKMCNPLTATLDKVNCRQLTDGFIVHTDETGLDASDRPVNQNEGDFAALNMFKGTGSRLCGSKNKPIYLSSK